MKFKKLLSLGLLIGSTIILTACSSMTSNKKFKTDQDMVAFGAISTANILEANSFVNVSNEDNKNHFTRISNEDKTLDMDKINEYVIMVENLLVDGGPILIKSQESDKEEYQTKLVYEVKNLVGEIKQYIIYYNEVLKEKSQFNNIDDDFDDRYDNEQEYILDGLAIIENKEYQLQGEKELENNESELKLIISMDNNNYVIFEEEKENQEVEYQYTVYNNGKKHLELEFELENNNKDVEIEFITRENGIKETFKFEKEIKFGQSIIVIKYRKNGVVYNIYAKGNVNSQTGQIEYEYKVNESNKQYNYQKK